MRALPGGGTERVEPGAADGAVPDRCAGPRRSPRSGARVEAHFGAPQDIEWALDAAGTLWLTQARPITTPLSRAAVAATAALRAFVCVSLAQGLTRPITPMGLAAFGVDRRQRWRGCSASPART